MLKTSDFKVGNFYLIKTKNGQYEGRCVEIYPAFIIISRYHIGCKEFRKYYFYMNKIESFKDLGDFNDYCAYKGWNKEFFSNLKKKSSAMKVFIERTEKIRTGNY